MTLDQSPAEILVFNALRDVVSDTHDVLVDPQSREIVLNAYHRSTNDIDRSRFKRKLEEISDLSRGELANLPQGEFDEIQQIVDRVLVDLEGEGTSAIVNHQISTTFSPRQVTLYSFIRSQEMKTMDGLAVSPSMKTTIDEGVELVADERFEQAASHFREASSRAEGQISVILDQMAGWALFWGGNDALAADVAEEVRRAGADQWDTSLLWIAATHNRSDKIRQGLIDVGVILRWLCDIPSSGGLDIWIGIGEDEGIEWTEISKERDYALIDRIALETHIQFRIEGALPAFPRIHSYYMGVGTIDHRIGSVHRIGNLFFTGPEVATNTTESVRFRHPDSAE